MLEDILKQEIIVLSKREFVTLFPLRKRLEQEVVENSSVNRIDNMEISFQRETQYRYDQKKETYSSVIVHRD